MYLKDNIVVNLENHKNTDKFKKKIKDNMKQIRTTCLSTNNHEMG